VESSRQPISGTSSTTSWIAGNADYDMDWQTPNLRTVAMYVVAAKGS